MDEKLFKLQTPLNNWVYAKHLNKKWISDERLYVERQAFVESIMIFADISMYGKASIHFIEPNVHMDGINYCTRVLKKFIPQLRKLCRNFILQQDGTRCHTYTLSYICSRVLELLEPEFWPLYRPQPFRLLSLELCGDCDTPSSERRQVRPTKERNRQRMEYHSSGNYR